MKTPEQILVAHDFSTCSRHALNYAIELAAKTGAELHILHVEVIHVESLLPEEVNKTKAQIFHDHLKKEIRESAERQDLFVSDINAIRYVVLRNISAADAIVNYSNEYKIDLIILGTHGRKGLSRSLLGSVAEEVVRTAPASVLTVRETESFTPLSQHIHNIAVPVDFSESSKAALHYARELALAFGAQLDIIHVIEEKLHPAFYNTGAFSIYDLQPEIKDKLGNELEAFYKTIDGPPVVAKFTLLHGNPSREIINHLQDEKADLLVLSTHGLTGLRRMLMGSVAERLIREAPCPVLTVKNTEPALMSISPFAANYEDFAP